MEDAIYLKKQEILYFNSNFLYNKWYRKIYGGKWYLIKIGRDTPNIRLFSVWTKEDIMKWEGYNKLLEIEVYEYTGVDTKFKFFKQLIKNILGI